MRNTFRLSIKCQCKTCNDKNNLFTDLPCKDCRFTSAGSNDTIGDNHSTRPISMITLKHEMDSLNQRIEQLEFEQLTTCLCKKKIKVIKFNNNNIIKRKYHDTTNKRSTRNLILGKYR